MSANNKVIWSEGMFLRPQHFQQQDRYLERFVEGRTQSLGAYLWGFAEIAIDNEPLSLGKISVAHIKGVFPDGTPFSAPENEELPAVLDVAENTQDEVVYLCIPLRRPGAQESIRDQEDYPQARYRAYNFDARNSTSQSGEPARIQIGKLRICLKLGSEDLSGYAAIPLTRIKERPTAKAVKLDRHFIPPVMSCQAAPEIKAYFEEIKGLLKQRGEALSHRLTDSGRAGSAEIADYMLLQVVNRAEPLFKHLAVSPCLHPANLYIELLQLAGELATFTTKDKRPGDIPPYQHDQLQQTFAGLFIALRQSLSMVLEQSAISLPLVERKFGIHVAPISDHTLISTSTFVIAAKANVQTELLRSRFPSQAKIAPVETIRELISTQLPGLKLRPLPVAPRQIPYHAGFTYFELDPTGDLWAALKQSGGFAVHVGADFPGLSMELWAVRN